MLKIKTTPVKCLIFSIVINLALVTTALAQQTCATKGNYPLPEISESAKNKLQQDLDSIMEIRTLDRKDSIKFKSILNPQNLPKAAQAKSPTTKKTVDKPVIYKTPMKSEK